MYETLSRCSLFSSFSYDESWLDDGGKLNGDGKDFDLVGDDDDMTECLFEWMGEELRDDGLGDVTS